MFKGIFRKADIILLIMLIVIGAVSSVALSMSETSGSRVEIRLNGKLYGSYSLAEDRTIRIENRKKYNVVQIRNGKVSVTEASCKNQICVEHAPISKTGETIVCLPNKLSVTIPGKGDDQYDAVSS